MKEFVWVAFAFLVVFATGTVRAESTTYKWNEVNKRLDGTPTEHQISYRVRHNGIEHDAADTAITLAGYPKPGSESCVQSVEHYPGDWTMQSPWNCVVINARPEPPVFRMIQLLE